MIAVSVPAFAQSGGGFELKVSHIGSGTVEPLTGGGFIMQGTVGQAGAGTVSGGGFELTLGFWSVALSEGCGDACQLYGDVFPVGGDCVIDVDDLLITLDGFSDPDAHPETDIAPCGGNGVIDVDDILAELDAFSGIFACPHPCPPESPLD